MKKWILIIIGGLVALSIIGSLLGGGQKATVSTPASSAAQSTSQATATPKAIPTPTAAPKVGDTVAMGNWFYTVTQAENVGKTLVWSQYGNKTEAAGSWLLIYITLKNVGKETYSLNSWDFTVTDNQGLKYKVGGSGDFMFAEYKKLAKPFGPVPPGVAVDTVLVVDVNPAATGLGLWLEQAKATIDLGK